MSTLSPLIEAWDESHREFTIAMGDFPDEDLWKRPHSRLLSAGENAGHIAYWQAVWTLGGGNDRPDLEKLSVKSPLLNHAFRYYTTTVDHPFQVDLSAAQVLEEVARIHEVAKAVAVGNEKDEKFSGQWGTWGNFVQYQVIHVAYHTGQVYSLRHLLGHETEDN